MLESLKGQMSFPHDLYAETFDLIPWLKAKEDAAFDSVKNMKKKTSVLDWWTFGLIPWLRGMWSFWFCQKEEEEEEDFSPHHL